MRHIVTLEELGTFTAQVGEPVENYYLHLPPLEAGECRLGKDVLFGLFLN